MKTRKALRLATSVAMVTGGLAGCSTSHHPVDTGRINHIVLITLNEASHSEALMADCDRMLATIPSVTAYACGPHVETGRTKAVNDQYTLGLLVSFDDMTGYMAYLEHPGHLALLEKWKPEFSELTIYDFGDASDAGG